MRSLLAKLLIAMLLLLSIGNASAMTARGSNGVKQDVGAAAADLDAEMPHGTSADCDDETCAQHQCHLGHCQFFVTGQDSDPSLRCLGLHLAFYSCDDVILHDHLSSQIKPPATA